MPTACFGLYILMNYISRACTAFSGGGLGFLLFLLFWFWFLVWASPWKPAAQATRYKQSPVVS